MQMITTIAVDDWLAKHGPFSGHTLASVMAKLDSESVSYQSPQDALSCYDFARFLWAHYGGDETLIVQTEHSIFTGEEELLLYSSYLTYSAGKAALPTERAVLLRQQENQHFVNVLGMNMIFKWDCLIAFSEGNSVFRFSHDGEFSILTGNEEFLSALKQLGIKCHT